LYYDGNSLNEMNAENEDDFLHYLATNHPYCENNLTELHVDFTFRASKTIYQYFAVAIISTMFITILHDLSHKMIFAAVDV